MFNQNYLLRVGIDCAVAATTFPIKASAAPEIKNQRRLYTISSSHLKKQNLARIFCYHNKNQNIPKQITQPSNQ